MRRVALFSMFEISLIFGLTENSCIILSASAFDLLWYIVLAEAYEEVPASETSLEKGGTLLTSSLQISLFDTILNLINGSFLKITCNVEYKTTLINLLNCYRKIHPSCTWNASFCSHDFVTSRTYKNHAVVWKILVHWVMQGFQTLAHFMIWYEKKSHSLISLLISSEK